ncbi:MAG: hypothetical protein SCK28_05900 [Bacillota bacterium]|nr:hypothetical protein [Bacillota bacterium]
MSELKELEGKMKYVMSNLKDTVDLSLDIRAKHPETKKIIDSYWEEFLSHFVTYIKRREKETGDEVLKGFAFLNLFKLIK